MAAGTGLAFETEWTAVAQEYAASRGYRFSDECLSDLRGFLAGGLANLGHRSSEIEIRSYNSSVVQLVQAMIDESAEVADGETILHEWTLQAARVKFCPLFPFC
ncbi:hypothetical protein SAMN05443244_2596 [Terriglobus roseus]|uniref:Uncharacterized protein n=2 Tax=Terriglobus roseus TaxID=392734 RepID=A0A1H4PL44_9BACT|nr:hypothetical protein SAMN05443244_2596 [Terriglobus roseus]